MKRKIVLTAALTVLLLPALIFSNPSGISNIIITPPNPAPGSVATIQWTYNSDNTDTAFYWVMLSSSTTPGGAGSPDQFLIIGNGCVTPPSPETATTSGCSTGATVAGANTVGPVSFTVPINLVPGNSYQAIIGMNEWWIAVETWGINPPAPDTSLGVSSPAFMVPMPPGSASITKTAENSVAKGGDFILYSINYSVVNSDVFIITDTVPPNCTLVKMSLGGTSSGSTPGSTLEWNLGNISATKTGTVWFIVQVDAAVPVTTISNTASWAAIEHNSGTPISGTSNDAPVTTYVTVAPVKSQSTTSLAQGDTVTYTLDFSTGGASFFSYDTFDTDISGFHDNGGGGIWSWQSTGAGTGGCLYSADQTGYPHYLKDTPADFCFGDIQGDVYIIDGTNKDGLICFRDGGAPGLCAYGVGISPDGNNGAASTALWVQKFCGAVGGYQQSVPASISINTWYTIKIHVTDGGNNQVRIQAKQWLRGTTEPAGWAIDWYDTSGTPASCGYVGFQGNDTNANQYDNLKIVRTDPSYPVVYDTIPAEISFIDGTAADLTHGGPVLSGGMVKWDINTTLTYQPYTLQWWGAATGCYGANNIFSVDSVEDAPVDSNSVVLTIVGGCNSPTITPTWTESETAVPSDTSTPTYTRTVTYTMTTTLTMTATLTRTVSATVTSSPTPVVPFVLTEVCSVPNPADVGTDIVFNLTVAADVTIKIFTISGELVRSMDATEVSANLQHGAANTRPGPGNNYAHWDLRNKNGQPVSSGIYFYRLEAKTAAESAFYISKLAVLR